MCNDDFYYGQYCELLKTSTKVRIDLKGSRATSLTSIEIDSNFGARLQQFTVLSVVEIVVAHARASGIL